jgi:hypothetical protein
MSSLVPNVVAGCVCCLPFILPERSGPFLNASACLPGRRQCHPLTPTIRCSIRLRPAEKFRSLGLGECAQEDRYPLVVPRSARIIELRVGWCRVTYCYLSDAGPEVYIDGYQDRGLSHLLTQ